MIMRATSVIALSSFLIGCGQPQPQPSQEEIWAEVEGCGGQELCSSAKVAALSFNKQTGRDFGNGVTLRGAETDGRLVSVGLDVPARVVDAKPEFGRTLKQRFGDVLQQRACSSADTKRFLSLGGEIRFTTYLPSGQRFSENSVSSC